MTTFKFLRKKIEVSFLLYIALIQTFAAKVSHQKAQTSSALAQLEAVESDDNSDDEAVLDHIFDGESKPAKTGDLDDEEEFAEHFGDMPPSQLLILQWYYRILPGKDRNV